MMRRVLTILLAAMLAAGCTMIPDYQRPDAGVPQTWPDGPAYAGARQGGSGLPAGDIGWRDFFVDAQLRDLIERALQNNSDAKLAALDVARVRARYQLQKAELLPQVDAEASYTRQHTPGNFGGGTTGTGAGAGTGGGAGAGSGRAGGGGTYDYYRVGVGLTAYELDLFGRIRSLNQQALQQYLATQEALRSAQISLIAAVANAYLQLLADRTLLDLAVKTRDAQRDSLALIEKRFDAGIASQLDVHQAQTALDTARADAARFARQAAQSRNALVELVGTPLSDAALAKVSLKTPKTGALPKVGLRSELLLRRPDVLAAEHQLQAANADIGAARAAFFPSISLLGSYGTISTDLDGLFASGSESWSFTPQISVPIFDGGRNDANLDVAEISKKIEVAQYRKTIRTAFREVADALAARGTLGDELAARRDKVTAAHGSYRLARKRYRKGIDSYLSVLDSLRTLYQARQDLIDAELAGLSNRVDLYKVLGGGWRAHSVQPDNRETSSPPGGDNKAAG